MAYQLREETANNWATDTAYKDKDFCARPGTLSETQTAALRPGAALYYLVQTLYPGNVTFSQPLLIHTYY